MESAREPPQPPGQPFPAFEPHPWLRGGHRQTIAGRYLLGGRLRLPATAYQVDAGGGDRLSVLDSTPPGWAPGDAAAVLVHGLGGCATAPYVTRVAARLVRLGIRALRMNLRGAGAGFGLARGTYHSGRTDDLRAVGRWLAERSPGSPVAWLGFSLGANLVLKLAAEAADHPPDGLDCVLAANPPIDLAACCRYIQRPENRIYDRNFVRLLRDQIGRLHARFPELPPIDLTQVASLYGFDEAYTAPQNGFAGAEDYYARCSAGPLLPRIGVPGLVVHAEDDPFIPAEAFRVAEFPSRLALELIPSGGHLGYVHRRAIGGDRRWLDARFTAWLADHWKDRLRVPAAGPPRGGLPSDRPGVPDPHARHPFQ